MITTRFSSFYETALDRILQSLGIDSLFLAGFSSDVCVRMTALDAYNRGYRLFLLTDCVHADIEDTETSIEYLRQLTNLEAIANKEIKAVLQEQHI